jgi:adenine-specific DNA glycosylase
LHQVEKCQENLVKHSFSHFDLTISIAHIPVLSFQLESSMLCINEADGLQWVDRDQLKEFGLPAPIGKILSSQL